MIQKSGSGAIVKSLLLNAATITERLDNSLGAIHGICFNEYMVLLSLTNGENQMLRQIDLAKALSTSGFKLARLLKPMEKTGLVFKDINESDIRMSLIKITAAGEELFNNACVIVDTQAQIILKNLDKENQDKLLSLSRMI
ncbi:MULTISPECIES: hypothetical protein [unclassified Alteromonas]|uniref:hypothetical protein n=1 Tax=unclassified Alteromonas TaxID=2614992 RepID=UPI00068F83A7|nr:MULTISPECIES: hypothetical protein [unclassified Alteromonas]